MKSGPGIATVIGLSLAGLAAAVAWVRRGQGEEGRERRAVLGAAVAATALGEGYTALAVKRGWVRGGLFDMPVAAQMAFHVPMSIAFYTLWLAGYRTLTAGSRHPYWTYGAISAGFTPLTMAVEPWEMKRGYFRLGKGFKVGYNAAATQVIMWAPLLAYEGLRQWPISEPERPEAIAGKACGLPQREAHRV